MAGGAANCGTKCEVTTDHTCSSTGAIVCRAGYYQAGTSCAACPPGSYCSDGNKYACDGTSTYVDEELSTFCKTMRTWSVLAGIVVSLAAVKNKTGLF